MDRALIASTSRAAVEAEQFAREEAELAAARLGERDLQRVANAVTLALAYPPTNRPAPTARTGLSAFTTCTVRCHHSWRDYARSMYARALAALATAAWHPVLEAALADSRALLGPKASTSKLVPRGEPPSTSANVAGRTEPPMPMPEALAISPNSSRLTRRTCDAGAHAPTITAGTAPPPRHSTLATQAAEVVRSWWATSDVGARTMVVPAMLEGRLDAAAREIDAVSEGCCGVVTGHRIWGVALARGMIARARRPGRSAADYSRWPIRATPPKGSAAHARMGADQPAQLEQGALAQALVSFERALKEFERLETSVTPSHADTLVGLGRVHMAQGDAAKALPLFEQADQFWRAFDPSSRSAAEAADWLARARGGTARRS